MNRFRAFLPALLLVFSCHGGGGSSSTPSLSDDPGCDDINAVGNGMEVIPGPSGPEGEDYDQPFRSLTVDPTDANRILCGTERNGVVLSRDGGSTWERLRLGLRHFEGKYPEIWDIAISPRGLSNVILATKDSPGPLTGDYPSSMAGVYRWDSGGSPIRRSNCGLRSPNTTSVLFDPADPQLVVLGMEGGEPSMDGFQGQYSDGGLFYSTDGGAHWAAAAAPAGAARNGYWHLRKRAGSFITFGCNYDDPSTSLGFLKSTDGGRTWVPFGDASIRTRRILAFDLSSDGNVIYAHDRDTNLIWKSANGGSSWSEMAPGFGGTAIALKVFPLDSNIVLCGTRGGGLYKTTDGGLSWAAVRDESGNSLADVQDVEFAPSAPLTVWAVTYGYKIYKSENGADTFQFKENLRDWINGQP